MVFVARRNNKAEENDLDGITWRAPNFLKPVYKVGCSTGKPTGFVTASEMVMKLVNPEKRTEWIVTTEYGIVPGPKEFDDVFSATGDSGSAIVAADSKAVVGIMFGGGVNAEKLVFGCYVFHARGPSRQVPSAEYGNHHY